MFRIFLPSISMFFFRDQIQAPSYHDSVFRQLVKTGRNWSKVPGKLRLNRRNAPVEGSANTTTVPSRARPSASSGRFSTAWPTVFKQTLRANINVATRKLDKRHPFFLHPQLDRLHALLGAPGRLGYTHMLCHAIALVTLILRHLSP